MYLFLRTFLQKAIKFAIIWRVCPQTNKSGVYMQQQGGHTFAAPWLTC